MAVSSKLQLSKAFFSSAKVAALCVSAPLAKLELNTRRKHRLKKLLHRNGVFFTFLVNLVLAYVAEKSKLERSDVKLSPEGQREVEHLGGEESEVRPMMTGTCSEV